MILYRKKIQKAQYGLGNIMTTAMTSFGKKPSTANIVGGGVNLNTGTSEGQSTVAKDTAESSRAMAEFGKNNDTTSVVADGLKTTGVAKIGGDTGSDAIVDTGALVKSSQASLNGAKTVAEGAGKAAGGLKGMMGGAGSAGAGAAIGAVGEIASGLVSKNAGIDYEDLDKEVDQGKMAGGAALGGAAKGAQMGMAFGPWGAAIGGVVGGVAGFFGGKKKAKEEEERRHKLVVKRDTATMDKNQAKEAEESNRLAANVSSKYSTTGKAIVARKGTKFLINATGYTLPNAEITAVKRRTHCDNKLPVFRKGGTITNTTNIIPDGVSHEEENSMGTKGMPVVKCTKTFCSKVYEIESDELIVTKDVAKRIEDLAKNKKADELGKFMAKQILTNTHSYTEKFDL